MVIDTVPWNVMRITDHDAAERLSTQFVTSLVGYFGKDGAPKDTEIGRVSRFRHEQGDRNSTREANRAAMCKVAEVHNNVYRARQHGIWDGHAVQHR
jgi:hypothetical protein